MVLSVQSPRDDSGTSNLLLGNESLQEAKGVEPLIPAPDAPSKRDHPPTNRYLQHRERRRGERRRAQHSITVDILDTRNYRERRRHSTRVLASHSDKPYVGIDVFA